jgi:hypothetical protein
MMSVQEFEAMNSPSTTHLLALASHTANALLLALYLYSPLGEAPGLRLVIQSAVFPALVFTAAVLWLLPAVRARLSAAAA